MKPYHQHRPSDTVSAKYKNSHDLSGGHQKRVRDENEALPPANDLWQRPVYVPSRDTHNDCRDTTMYNWRKS